MIERQCELCNSGFKTYPAWIRKGGGRFCSFRCKGKWQSENVWGENHPAYRAANHKRLCMFCKDEFKPHNKRSKYCSYVCKGKAVRDSNHGRYKPVVGYMAVHNWLRSHFGSAKECENHYCPGTSSNYQWSLVQGLVCERNRANFWQLCRTCHMIYDRKYYPISKNPIK